MVCLVHLLVAFCISHCAVITVVADPCGFNSQCTSIGANYGAGCGFCCVGNSEFNINESGSTYDCGSLGYFDCTCPAGKGYYPASSREIQAFPPYKTGSFGIDSGKTHSLHVTTVNAPTLKPTYVPTLAVATQDPTTAPIQVSRLTFCVLMFDGSF